MLLMFPAIVEVEPYSVLELVVGSGGGAGVCGTDTVTADIAEQRRLMAMRRTKEIHMPIGFKLDHDREDYKVEHILGECGVSLGGQPGGGQGNGGGGCWASGGGGGYSIVSKRSPKGNQALLVAGGGGGSGSLHGLPGAGLEGILHGTLIDPINGGTASVDTPGYAGESGSTYNAAWTASVGAQWQGGEGCEFGAG